MPPPSSKSLSTSTHRASAAFERVHFDCARPATVVLTTPNREYNALFPTLPAGKFRHRDHRFEWTRAEFAAWCESIQTRFSYPFKILPIGLDTRPSVRPRR